MLVFETLYVFMLFMIPNYDYDRNLRVFWMIKDIGFIAYIGWYVNHPKMNVNENSKMTS